MKPAHLWASGAALLCSVVLSQSAQAEQIVIGQTLPLTGGQATMAVSARNGAEAYIAAVNRKGGVNGRKLVLKTLDDELKPDLAAANVRELANKEDAIGIISMIGGPSALAAVPIATPLDLPIVGVMNGNPLLRSDKAAIINHVRVTFAKELEVIVRQYTTAGQKRFAMFYGEDAPGKASAVLATEALAAQSMKPVALVGFDRAAKDFQPYAAQLAASKAQIVIINSPAKIAAELIKALRALDPTVSVVCLSNVDDRALFALMGEESRGIAISSIVPNPFDTRVPLVQEFQRDMIEAGHQALTIASLEGYVNAKVLVEGLKRLKTAPTRSGLRKALKSVPDLDLGGAHLITTSEPMGDGLDSVDILMLSRNGKLVR